MKGKLALVGAVGVVWLLTFVLFGGNVFPALDGHHGSPSSTPTSASTTPLGPTATPIGPSASPGATPTGSNSSPTSSPGSLSQAAQAAEHLARTAPVAGATLSPRPTARRLAASTLTFRMATYNALGSSHTRGSKSRASGPSRMSRGAAYVEQHDLSIVGFQEMQGDQRAEFKRATGGRYGLFPDNSLNNLDGDNSIAYRLDTWQLVKSDSIPIEYFGGANRNMPILLLRNLQTGIKAYFTNFHNPADVHGPAGRFRAVDKVREVALFNNLARSGLPVFVTGDMNERQTYGCQIVTGADMRMAAGGDGRNGCTVQTNRTIDWIGASYNVQFANYVEDRSAAVHAMTDHPIVSADATISTRDFPRALG